MERLLIYYREPLVRASSSLGFQASLLSKKGSHRSRYGGGGVVKMLRRRNSPSRIFFITAGSFGHKIAHAMATVFRKQAEYGFVEYGFKHRAQ